MIPIHDENPHQTKPIATLSLVVVFLIIFGFEFLADARGVLDLWLTSFGLIPTNIWALIGYTFAAEYVSQHEAISPSFVNSFFSFFSYVFLHAGWLHILPNLLFLWIFGDNVEDAFGRIRFLLFFFMSAVVAGMTHVLVAGPLVTAPLLGASGAISALLGVYFKLYPKVRIRVVFPTILLMPPLVLFGAPFLWFFSVPAYVFLGLWFSLDLYQAIFTESETVAFSAHIAGFVFGYLVAAYLRRDGETSFYRQKEMSEAMEEGGTARHKPSGVMSSALRRKDISRHPNLRRHYHASSQKFD